MMDVAKRRRRSMNVSWALATAAAAGLALSAAAWGQEQDAPAAPPAADAAAADAPALDAPAPVADDAADVPVAPAPAEEMPADVAPAEELPAPAEPAPTPVDAANPADPNADAATQPALQIPEQILANGRTELADRSVEMAQLVIRDAQLGESAFRQAVALLEAATKLNGNDPRTWRLLTDAKLQLGDRKGALEALAGLRAVAPQDAIALVQTIELHTAGIQAVDKELIYLRGLLAREGNAALPDEVRSHVNYMIAQRLADRGEHAGAIAALDEAVKLNPVNVTALDLKYRGVVGGGGTAQARATALFDLIKANPVQPNALAEMGRLLGEVGLNKEATDWLNRALILNTQAGITDPAVYHALGIDYASQLYIGGQLQAVRNVTDQILKGNPNDIDAWFVRLVVERGGNDADTYNRAKEGAANALNASWAAAARVVSGEPAPEPGPDGQPAPAPVEPPAEPAAVAAQAKQSDDPAKRDAFVAAAADQAWFEIYFNDNAGGATKWIDALEAVVAEDNATLKRLRGWLQLANKQTDEARQTLEPLAGSDPLSAMGVVLAAPADKDAQAKADDLARQLIQDNPTGLVGAILAQGLKDRAVKPAVHPDAAAIRTLLTKMPRGWLDLAEHPTRFYSVKVEPNHISHDFAEPIYAVVTIRNLTDQFLPVSDNGVIRPGLWFDANVEAGVAQVLPGVAFERMARTTILPPKAGMQQMVRIDQGRLALMLSQNPRPRVQVTGWAMTNPVSRGQGFGPGPAGVRVPFSKKVTRLGFQIENEKSRQKLFEEIEQGQPEQRIRNVSLAAAQLPALWDAMSAPAVPEGQPAPPPDAAAQARRQQYAQLAEEMRQAIVRSSRDPIPPVAQWAKYELTRVGTAEESREAAMALLDDPAWEARMLGLAALRNLRLSPFLPEAGDLAKKLAEKEGEEPVVKAFAAEVVEVIRNLPTTQPVLGEGAPAAEQPAEGAAPAPAAGEPPPTEAGPAK